MKTVPYDTVLRHAAELAGYPYEDGSGKVLLSTEDEARFRGFVGHSIRSAWTAAPWPETCIVEQRTFAPRYDATRAYAAGDVVWDPLNGEYAVALKSIPAGTSPPSSIVGDDVVEAAGVWYVLADGYPEDEWDNATTYAIGELVWHSRSESHYALHSSAPAGTDPTNASFWCRVPELERRIDFQANGETVIGDVFGIYLTDPNTESEPEELSYTQDPEGIIVLDLANGVYVKFWTMPPSFTSPQSTVLHRFGEFAAFSAAGLILRADGKTDQGMELLRMAKAILDDDVSRLASIDTRVRRVQITR
jgi:hypothetical protein